jgi:ppGpp synthetase/RelA/SpoT-type nucleotidyltranferase
VRSPLYTRPVNRQSIRRGTFWAELQVRTLAQRLWSEMSHDTVYKNDGMVAKLAPDVQRLVVLMAPDKSK